MERTKLAAELPADLGWSDVGRWWSPGTEVTLGTEVRSVHENESIYVPIGSTQRLANPGKIALELIEVQVGSYLGEDDIVRLDDVYARR